MVHNGGQPHDSVTTGFTRVEDKYLIQEDAVVGKGAWSVVKKCTPIAPYWPAGTNPGMKFVVKIIEKDYLVSLTKGDVDRAMSEVNREIDVLRSIPPHDNVVTFVEHVETEKQFLLFFEEVYHGDLCELILSAPDAKMAEDKAKYYTYQIIKAVLHCHLHDVIHRDIKPENLLVGDDDNIKLTDFGLAKRSKGVCTGDDPVDPLSVAALIKPYPGCERLVGKRVVCSDVIGTPRYGAPEMFYAKFTQTHYDGFNADTWSIGVVTYITLSGSFPYSAGNTATEKEVFRTIMDTPLPHPAGVSEVALDFIQRLLNKDPARRIPLYEALNHPWLAPVAVPRGSVVAARLLREHQLPAVQDACRLFNEEARNLHAIIGSLQHEMQLLREERDRAKEEQLVARVETRSQPRRAATPTGTSRIRQSRSPGPSARVASPVRAGLRPRTASRDGSSGSIPSRQSATAASTPVGAPAARARSPLARSAGGAAVRRGTPVRAGGTTPARSGTPSRNTRSGSAVRGTTRAATPNGRRASTPLRGSASGRVGSRTTAAAAATGGAAAAHSTSMNPANELHIGDQVTYKGYRAVVRFNGPTAFGAGIWIGLEMLEGNEGTNDGSSFIDKKQYFVCPKGKGVFVRASQVKKL